MNTVMFRRMSPPVGQSSPNRRSAQAFVLGPASGPTAALLLRQRPFELLHPLVDVAPASLLGGELLDDGRLLELEPLEVRGRARVLALDHLELLLGLVP